MATSPLLQLENVSFAYGGEPVLDRLTLDVQPGEYVGVIGPNGGGKTTLIKVMLGLIQPGSGQVHLFGQPLSEFKDCWRIGYVPQTATSFDARFPITVEEVVALGRVARLGLGRRFSPADRAAVHKALDQV